MFKKLLVLFCLGALLFSSIGAVLAQSDLEPSPAATEAAENKEAEEEYYDFASMTTYEMFWPLTAGKVPGDKLYRLKVWRDKLMGILYFSKLKKSEYLKQIANKRLVEAERLLELERYSYLGSTLEKSSENLEKGLELLSGVGESIQTEWLRLEFSKDLAKHSVVLGRMKEKAPEGQKQGVEKAAEIVRNLTEKYQLEY